MNKSGWKILSSEKGEFDLPAFAGFKSSEIDYFKITHFFSEKNPFIKRSQYENLLLISKDNRICARATLCFDVDTDGKIGFFQCHEDYEMFEIFLEYIIECFKNKGFKSIIAPMNFSSWFDYRFLVKEEPGYLKGKKLFLEPSNESYYPIFFETYGFREFKKFFTFISEKKHFEKMLKKVKKLYDLSIKMNYFIRNFDPSQAESEFKAIFDIFSISFSKFPGMNSVNFEEFYYYIKPLKSIIKPELIKFICDPDGQPVGVFAGFMTIPGENLVSLVYITSISKKEIFCASALIYAYAQELLKQECPNLLLSLVADTSSILPLIKDTKIIREYALYKLNIP